MLTGRLSGTVTGPPPIISVEGADAGSSPGCGAVCWGGEPEAAASGLVPIEPDGGRSAFTAPIPLPATAPSAGSRCSAMSPFAIGASVPGAGTSFVAGSLTAVPGVPVSRDTAVDATGTAVASKSAAAYGSTDAAGGATVPAARRESAAAAAVCALSDAAGFRFLEDGDFLRKRPVPSRAYGAYTTSLVDKQIAVSSLHRFCSPRHKSCQSRSNVDSFPT